MTTMLDEESRADVERADSYLGLLARLSHQSVVKHFDAYADVAWDALDMTIDAADPRWVLSADDPLALTAWYQSQPPETKARIGLHRIAVNMKVGLQFESVLKRGLLEYASRLPNGAPEFRYAYHEVIEEAQHSLMFQEFVNRTGLEVGGMPWYMEFGSRRVVRLGRRFPELFFLFVLGGEDPIDFVQRRALRSGEVAHPLLERIMRIHVTRRRVTCRLPAITSSAMSPGSVGSSATCWPYRCLSSWDRWRRKCSDLLNRSCGPTAFRGGCSRRPTATTPPPGSTSRTLCARCASSPSSSAS
jgi:hypothetical protein